MAEETARKEKAIIASIGFFASTSPFFKEVADTLGRQNKRLINIVSGINDVLIQDAYALEIPQATPEPQENISSIVSRTQSRAIDLAGLGLIIPLLFNKEARDWISGFANGLFGIENVETLNTALKAITAVLAGVFAYKVFKQVGDTIETFKRLSNLVSSLFLITDEAAVATVDEKKEIEEKKTRDKDKRKKIRENRVARQKRIQKFKNIFKAFKFGGPIGFAVGTVVGVGIGTAIDLISESDMRQLEAEDAALENDSIEVPEPSGDIKTDNILSIIKNNIVEQFSFGLLSWDNIRQLVAPSEEQKKINIENLGGASVGGVGEFAEMGDAVREDIQPEEIKSPETAVPNISVESPAPQTGSTINNTSETVNNIKKTTQSNPIITINNIDTSTVLSINKTQRVIPNDYIPTSSVGMA